MKFYKLPPLIQFLVLLTAVHVLLFSLFRVAFWTYFNDPSDPVAGADLWYAFYVGLKFDLRLALLIALPLFLFGWIKYLSPFASAIARYVWLAYLAIAMVAVFLFYIINFGYYAYLHVPLDATALRFLENAQTSAQMVWESYPVLGISVGLIVATVVYVLAVNWLTLRQGAQPPYRLRKRVKIAVVTATFFLTLFGIYGKVSWYPLRWSDAFAAHHPFASAVTINPVLYSLNTLKNRSVEFDEKAVRDHYEDMVGYLGVTEPDAQALNFTRLGRANPLKVQQPNIVVVILESFANYKSSLSGNPADPTPNFAALAQDGIYFKNFFTPHAGTARSVFAAVTGLPDVEKVKTSTRNPLVVNQRVIINEFEGYEKYYFIGGSASWGNIRGLLSHNIPGLRLYEEGSYESPRVDVWGISDLHLFEEANQVLRKADQPFFAIIQTSGNHRPYTIPEDNRGFVYREYDEAEIRRYGFQSEAEYNSFRFMDHSIGVFMEQARKEEYFEDTVFVFFGDHGIRANPGEHSPEAEAQLALNNIHVPLVFYAPALLPKGKVEGKMASEVDVMATLAGLANGRYRNTTLGRDLFDERFDAQRYAFTAINDGIMRIGLIGPDFYFRMNEDGSNKVLHKIDSDSPRDNVMESFPQQTQHLERLTRAIYETARYMRFHNGRQTLASRGQSNTEQ
jgi:phosphoglycerol transferase MdoB-like AlkP superfamily enzyme